jgi:hypothetical protein
MPESHTPLAAFSSAELEQALRDVGPYIAYPVTPDLTSRVRAALHDEIVPAPRAAPISPLPRRRALWLAAAAILVLVGALALFPQMRTAIADRLGLSGVQIRWLEEAPTPNPSPVGTPLMVGRPVTLHEARAAVDFPLLLPGHQSVSGPNEIYLLGIGDDAMVSFVYPASPELPASDETGVGALLTQFQGSAGRDLIAKGLYATGEDPETRLESVTVNGEPGFWISGAPHGFFLVCHDDGDCREERYRLAGNVLLWERDGVTLRLESALPKDEALAIAASVHTPD